MWDLQHDTRSAAGNTISPISSSLNISSARTLTTPCDGVKVSGRFNIQDNLPICHVWSYGCPVPNLASEVEKILYLSTFFFNSQPHWWLLTDNWLTAPGYIIIVITAPWLLQLLNKPPCFGFEFLSSNLEKNFNFQEIEKHERNRPKVVFSILKIKYI